MDFEGTQTVYYKGLGSFHLIHPTFLKVLVCMIEIGSWTHPSFRSQEGKERSWRSTCPTREDPDQKVANISSHHVPLAKT